MAANTITADTVALRIDFLPVARRGSIPCLDLVWSANTPRERFPVTNFAADRYA
jgi:hypothetical protein